MQMLSVYTGRALRRYFVVCESCWNTDTREKTIDKAISEQAAMNKLYGRK